MQAKRRLSVASDKIYYVWAVIVTAICRIAPRPFCSLVSCTVAPLRPSCNKYFLAIYQRLITSNKYRAIRRLLSDLDLVQGPVGYDPERNRLFYIPHATYFTLDMYPRAIMHKLPAEEPSAK